MRTFKLVSAETFGNGSLLSATVQIKPDGSTYTIGRLLSIPAEATVCKWDGGTYTAHTDTGACNCEHGRRNAAAIALNRVPVCRHVAMVRKLVELKRI